MNNIYATSSFYNPYSVYRYNYLDSSIYMAPPKVTQLYGIGLTPNYLNQLKAPIIDFANIPKPQINILANTYNQYGLLVNHLTLPQLLYLQV